MSTRRFPELRPNGWDLLVAACVALLAISIAAIFFVRRSQAEELTVVISLDGTVAQRCALEDFPHEEQHFEANGYTLIICLTMENGQQGIEVKASDCPTQDCVHTGVITQAGESIVCLPARLSIQLQGSKQPDTVDAVLG